MALKSTLARKAVKTTAKHTAHGTASKLKRDPMRASALLGLGALLGAAALWLLGRLGRPGQSGQTAVTQG
jgi:ferric-dicitrate binding protein FerR (iron transport regulator)